MIVLKVKLDSQEVMSAITVYMALRGFKTGEYFNFKWNPKRREFEGVEVDIEHANFNDLEAIRNFARKG